MPLKTTPLKPHLQVTPSRSHPFWVSHAPSRPHPYLHNVGSLCHVASKDGWCLSGKARDIQFSDLLPCLQDHAAVSLTQEQVSVILLP